MQATSLVSLEGDGEEFFLDILFNRILFNRMSVIDSMTMSAPWTRVSLAVQTNQKGPGEKEPIC
jgi:hypothetical protein